MEAMMAELAEDIFKGSDTLVRDVEGVLPEVDTVGGVTRGETPEVVSFSTFTILVAILRSLGGRIGAAKVFFGTLAGTFSPVNTILFATWNSYYI